MTDTSDWTLVAQARDGDEAAFGLLVRRYQEPLVHFCRRMVGSREDAEDIAQVAFLQIHRALPRLKPKAQFSTLLFGIARNLTLNHIRDGKRRGRNMAQSLTRDDETIRTVEDSTGRPDRKARLREIQETVDVSLRRLPPKFREVLVLREIQGMDYDTIAKVVKCRKGTVKSRIARAREQLRLTLLELGGDLL